MPHLLLELALWILLAFFIGSALGYLAHMLFPSDREPASEPQTTELDEPDVAYKASSTLGNDAAPTVGASSLEIHVAKGERPKGIAQARGGKPDNLQRISGIGPKNERTLHSLGFFHFEQIASWTDEEVAWVDTHMKFNGRIIREEWILQAGLLADGKEEEFDRLYSAGRHKSMPAS